MKAFHGKVAVKQFRLDQADFHIEHDMLLAGTYGEGEGTEFRGCTIGCHYQGDHSQAEAIDGLPEWYARLADTFFEGLELRDRGWWHKAWAQGVPVGFEDFDLVKARFLSYIMGKNADIVEALDIPHDIKTQVLEAIYQAKDVHDEAASNNGVVDELAARSAARAAKSAANSAAESAAKSAAWSAARLAKSARSAESAESAAWSANSAARSAKSAAWSEAWSAAESAESAAWSAKSAKSAAWSAESAAKSAEFKNNAEKIISLFQDAAMPTR